MSHRMLESTLRHSQGWRRARVYQTEPGWAAIGAGALAGALAVLLVVLLVMVRP